MHDGARSDAKTNEISISVSAQRLITMEENAATNSASVQKSKPVMIPPSCSPYVSNNGIVSQSLHIPIKEIRGLDEQF